MRIEQTLIWNDDAKINKNSQSSLFRPLLSFLSLKNFLWSSRWWNPLASSLARLLLARALLACLFMNQVMSQEVVWANKLASQASSKAKLRASSCWLLRVVARASSWLARWRAGSRFFFLRCLLRGKLWMSLLMKARAHKLTSCELALVVRLG